MKKLQIDVLEAGEYGFTLRGSNALKLLMDQSTPPIDLLVRESVQNSDDAVLIKKKFSRIYFNLGSFSSSDLCDCLETVGDNLKTKFKDEQYKFLSIKDTNTCGLLGKPFKEDGPNNLYKLVYSFLESKKENDAGGSWGIGKSVYYRYGIGMVFYYSRTYENNEYQEKLCGAIIENEEDENALLRDKKGSLGIAFIGENTIGKNGRERSIPIYDHEQIVEFLNIFNISPFTDDKTGTTIIIPYFNDKECASKFNTDEFKPWENDFLFALKMSIQRWYFPKISTEDLYTKYGKKYINIFVNGERLELNPFFQTLQNLYFKQVDGCEIEDIQYNYFNEKLGYFVFKKFTKEELGVMVPPKNLQNPYVLLDIKNIEDGKNSAIIFYTRKPGMIITYEDSMTFTSLTTEKDEYLIGLFVLNDDSYLKTCKSETLGRYFKECEAANHKKWEDITSSEKIEKITLLKTKPFRKIQNEIKKVLNNRFVEETPETVESVNTALQRKLGEFLLPPEDFGKDREASIPRKKKGQPTGKLINLKTANRINSIFNGFENGCASYTFQVLLKPNDEFLCQLLVDASSRKYTYEEWEAMNFTLPCSIKSLTVSEYDIGKMHYNNFISLDFKEKDTFEKRDGINDLIFKIISNKTSVSKNIDKIMVQNLDNEDVRITLNILLNPIDDTIGFSILRNILKIGGGIK